VDQDQPLKDFQKTLKHKHKEAGGGVLFAARVFFFTAG
jgi:hypothetical protein